MGLSSHEARFEVPRESAGEGRPVLFSLVWQTFAKPTREAQFLEWLLLHDGQFGFWGTRATSSVIWSSNFADPISGPDTWSR